MGPDPAELSILHYPHPALRIRAAPVPQVDDHVRAVAAQMIRLMIQAEGVGLAAPQVGLPWRLFVAHVPPSAERSTSSEPPGATEAPVVYVNPVLVPLGREAELGEEGCLSLPDVAGEVMRATRVGIEALALDGRPFRATAAGLLARCWQHEIDHLDGVLILDRMTQASRSRNRAVLRDLERLGRP
ncbi:MAG TPA: peptide deformylase [Phycisphaerales bacterium]|nr:peptide deformylase [Phycisphaerales bacterium]